MALPRNCEKCGLRLGDAPKNKRFCSKNCRESQYYMEHPRLKEQSKIRMRKSYTKRKNYQKKYFKRWYKKNKDNHKELVKVNYHRNVQIWAERKFTNYWRKVLSNYTNHNCPTCGKEIEFCKGELHHLKYGLVPKLSKHRKRNMKENIKKLKNYSVNLIRFCSHKCHRNYERKFTK